ncbi:lipid A export ATP-binding/permease protein MsbA [Clostridium sp. CAG:628]|nr:lipid A export ATP-binding/permease protein MsbA [Clostridium sp. CAG:628]
MNNLPNNTKPKNFTTSLKKLIKSLFPYKKGIIIVFIFSILSTLFTIVGPKVLGNATTELYNGVVRKLNNAGNIDYTKLHTILLTLLILYIISAIFNYIQGIVVAKISAKYTLELRKKVNRKMEKLPLKYFDKKSHGEVLSLITNDIDKISQNLSNTLTETVTCIIAVLGMLIMMFSINVTMTLAIIIILPICMILTAIIASKGQKYFTLRQEGLAKVDTKVEEMLRNHNIVKVFNSEDKILKEFNKENDLLADSTWKSNFIGGIMHPIMMLIGNLSYVVIAFLGGLFVIQGKITVGNIQSFITYAKNFTNPIGSLASIMTELESMIAASERVEDYLSEEEEKKVENPVPLNNVQGNITFDHVKFGYDENKIIIKDFTAHIESGKKIAIVGPTGSGKTTLVKLLMRFYDVNSGNILIDGVNIKDVERTSLRKNIGMVLQDTWLYSGTIMENIRYGRLDATDDEVIASAKEAQVHHFIQTLPDSYNLEINEETSNISEGQKQLLTIARAILKNPKILILDEATSSVDTRTEELIQKAMDTLMKGRTSFIIAHRLSTIKNADLILVLKDGDIIEQGTHEELLKKNGLYKSLYSSQFES